MRCSRHFSFQVFEAFLLVFWAVPQSGGVLGIAADLGGIFFFFLIRGLWGLADGAGLTFSGGCLAVPVFLEELLLKFLFLHLQRRTSCLSERDAVTDRRGALQVRLCLFMLFCWIRPSFG